MSAASGLAFGMLLRQLRKAAGMTQRDLAAALGYSDSLISGLETGQRQPDPDAILPLFAPALGLQDDPSAAQRLYEYAATVRGERPRTTLSPAPHLHSQRNGSRATAPLRLPALPVELIGRAETVAQLGNRLLGHGGRLLTLVGPPGVGKTTLALAVGERIQHLYDDGALFVPLAAVSDAGSMAAAILAQIAPGIAAAGPPQKLLVELLRRKRLLLVLDNLEQIPDAPPFVATLLAECPAVTILATSRERLHLRAEQRFVVPPLALEPAIALFVQRAQTVDGDFRRTEHNSSTLDAICTRLDCLPLALELAAAQIEIFTSAQLLAQLQDHSLDLLVDGAADLPPHQRTLRAAIQHSYDLLSADEQRLFRRLGVFVGGFDLAAVEGIGYWGLDMGDMATPISNPQYPIPVFRALIAKSLVRAETTVNGEQRFSLLETIREFALEQLRAQGEEEAARRSHYHYYLQRLRDADPHLRGWNVAVQFARLLPEYDNLRGAMLWALDEARYDDAAWLFLAASWYCRLRGFWYEDNEWLAALLPHRQRLAPELWSMLLINQASRARSPQDFARVRSYADELFALGEGSDNPLLHAAIWHFLAKATDDFDLAEGYWLKSIQAAREADELPNPGGAFGPGADRLFTLASTIDHYVLWLVNRGEFERALPLVQEGLQACEVRGYMTGVAAFWSHSGQLALLQGDLPQARGLLSQAVELATAAIHPIVLHRTQMLLAAVTLYGGETAEARRLLLESLQTWKNIGDTVQLARAYIYLAEAALGEGKDEEADQWLAQSAGYRIEPARLGGAVWDALFVAARLFIVRQEYRQAAALLGLAEETRQRARATLVEPVRVQMEVALTAVQEALDPADFAEAFAAGRGMEFGEVYEIVRAIKP